MDVIFCGQQSENSRSTHGKKHQIRGQFADCYGSHNFAVAIVTIQKSQIFKR